MSVYIWVSVRVNVWYADAYTHFWRRITSHISHIQHHQHNTHPYLHHVPHHPVCLTPPQHTHLPPKIAGRAFDEAKTEALLMTGAPGGPVWEEEGQGTDGWDWFTMLGIERPKVCICVHMCGIILIN